MTVTITVDNILGRKLNEMRKKMSGGQGKTPSHTTIIKMVFQENKELKQTLKDYNSNLEENGKLRDRVKELEDKIDELVKEHRDHWLKYHPRNSFLRRVKDYLNLPIK